MVKIKEPPGLKSSVISARRVVQIKDLSVLAGTYLVRYGIRTLLPALALTLAMLAGNRAMGGKENALPFTPLFLASLIVLIGYTLKFLPSLFSKKQLTTAEARGFDQLELYRKARLPVLLDDLERRVFHHEAVLQFTGEVCEAEEQAIQTRKQKIAEHLRELPPEILDWLGVSDASDLVKPLLLHRPLSSGIEASRSGFLITANYGLSSPLSETASHAVTGYDFSLLVDYLDGAPFHSLDQKLLEQYQGHPVLRSALKDIKTGKRKLPRYLRPSRFTRKSDILHSLSNTLDAITENLWRKGISREVMVRSGRAFSQIDTAFPDALITASSFLRPGDADNAYHRKFPGLPQALRKQGKGVLQGVLGSRKEDAFEMVDRMKMHSIIRAFALRIAYDPEYVMGSISPGFSEDVLELLADQPLPDRFARYIDEIRADQKRFEDQFDLEIHTRPQQRALRIAWHVNLHHLRSGEKEAEEAIIAETQKISEKLYYVRLHHALSLLDRAEYRHLVDVVAFDAE